MAGKSKTVFIRYREFNDPVGATRRQSFESAIRAALNTREDGVAIGTRWAKRIRKDPLDEKEHSVANHLRDGQTYIFGNLVAYTIGRDQATLVEDPNAREADIEQFHAPARRQFLNSMMFWMVTDNHVFVVRHGILSPPDSEEYFRWLLAERTRACGANLQVILNDKIVLDDPNADIDDIRAIRIGGQVNAHPPVEQPRDGGRRREVRRVGRAGGRDLARQVLDAVLGNNDRAVDRLLREVPNGVDISVNVEIGFETPKRKFSRDALNRVAIATRNLPDSDVQLVTKSGVIKGEEIRLSYPTAIPLVGSLLDREAVLEAMIEAYRHFVRTGKIQPSNIEVDGEE